MIDRRPFGIAQADGEHLQQSAFDRAGETGMGLHAIADHHVIGLEGEAIEVDGKVVAGPAIRRKGDSIFAETKIGTVPDDDRFDVGTDGAADVPLGDAERLDELPLTVGRAAAVAAHCRHDERLRAEAFEMLDNRSRDGSDIGDAAAAGGDGHALARSDFLAQVEPGKLGVNLARGVFYVGRIRGLAEAEGLRENGHGILENGGRRR